MNTEFFPVLRDLELRKLFLKNYHSLPVHLVADLFFL